jgi:hypothetical protein
LENVEEKVLEREGEDEGGDRVVEEFTTMIPSFGVLMCL